MTPPSPGSEGPTPHLAGRLGTMDARLPVGLSLVTKLTVFVGLLLAALIAVLLAGGAYVGHDVLRKEIDARLISVVAGRRDTVQAHIAQWEQLVSLLSVNGDYRGGFDELKPGETTPKMREYAQRSLDGFVHRGTFLSAVLADTTGRVQIASKGSKSGGELAGDAVFQSGLRGPHVGQPRRVDDHFEVVLSAPLADFSPARKTIGVLLITVDASSLAAAVRDTMGLGQSGEVVLGVREGNFAKHFFQPRHGDQSTFPLVEVPAMAAALEGRNFLGASRGYNGVQALAASMPVGYGGWGLVAKMDEAEAYAPIARMMRFGLLCGASVATAGLIAAYLLARGVMRPIRRLVEAASSVAKGNDRTPVPVSSADEFGVLSARFNEMTAALRARGAERDAKEDAVREGTERYELVVAGAGAAIWDWDVIRKRVFYSPQWKSMRGYSEEEVSDSGQEWSNRIHPEDAPRVLAAILAHVNGQTAVYAEEYRTSCKDGSWKWVFDRGICQRDEKGRAVRMAGSETDITERRQAEAAVRESEERLRLITNLVPHSIFAKDALGRFIFANRAFAATFSRLPEELLGHTDQDFLRDERETEAFRKTDMAVIESGKPVFVPEEPFTSPEGRTFIMQTTKIPFTVRGTGEPAVLGVAVDITALKQAEAEIRSLNASLEQRVAERTAQLAEVNQDLESFSYSVSHDLRAPLRAVNSYARMLLLDYGESLDVEGRRLLDVISGEGERMGLLIDALLSFSRLGRQAVSSSSVDMIALAREAFSEAAAEEPERRVDLHLADLPAAQGDPMLLRQVFVNLFSNAVKFTRLQTHALIEAGAHMEGGQTVYWVRDNGAGFDPRHMDQLFGVFQRLHRQDEFEGSGVGLAFVQRIIQRHGGRIWAEGKPDEGATFYFTLRQAKASPA